MDLLWYLECLLLLFHVVPAVLSETIGRFLEAVCRDVETGGILGDVLQLNDIENVFEGFLLRAVVLDFLCGVVQNLFIVGVRRRFE